MIIFVEFDEDFLIKKFGDYQGSMREKVVEKFGKQAEEFIDKLIGV